jgi:hypothetical protein
MSVVNTGMGDLAKSSIAAALQEELEAIVQQHKTNFWRQMFEDYTNVSNWQQLPCNDVQRHSISAKRPHPAQRHFYRQL